MRLELGNGQARESDELAIAAHLQGPESIAMDLETGFDLLDKSSLCLRLSGSGKCSITSGSALIAANASRSASHHRRSFNRRVWSVG